MTRLGKTSKTVYPLTVVKITMRGKLPLLVFFFCSVLVFASVGLGKEDPELKQCRHQCKVQQQYDRSEKQECEKRCEEYYKEKERRERGEGGEEEEVWNPENPERKLRECQKQCEQRGKEEEKRECQRRCLEEFRREEEEERGRGRGREETVENKRDPEEQFRRCREGCQREKGGQEQQRRCVERCEREYRQEHQHEGREEERRGGRGVEEENKKDPAQQFRECKDQCQRQRAGREQQRLCEQRCEREYEDQRRRGAGNPRREEGTNLKRLKEYICRENTHPILFVRPIFIAYIF